MSMTAAAGSWRWRRIAAVMRLEAQLLLGDRTTLSLIALVPVLQMLLFGAAVNLNPTGLTLAVSADAARVDIVRRAALASGYFDRIEARSESESAVLAVRRAAAQIAVDWHRAEGPIISADASDPATTRPAATALTIALLREQAQLASQALGLDSATDVAVVAPPVQWLYNPDTRTSWSLTPGLVGVIVMISMLLLGALTLVREREQGTWEALLSTAADGIDVLAGKLTPYLIAGVVQAATVALAAHLLFDVPIAGSMAALMIAAALLAAAHLLLGFALSAMAVTQLQAIQSAVFFYLPSMLLSGFMFPFAGMPRWAQLIGECLPLTHFVRIARGVMLRGDGPEALLPELWPMALFAGLVTTCALLTYRRHLT
jgi:ABC-2 type transport system permease protein